MYIPVKDHLFYHGPAASGAFAHYHHISFCGNGDAYALKTVEFRLRVSHIFNGIDSCDQSSRACDRVSVG